MTDTIDRRTAIRALEKMKDVSAKGDLGGFYNTIIENAIDMLKNLPSAQPEQKIGKWNIIRGNIVVCSECGMYALETMTGCLLNRHLEPNRTNFCPDCGAKMERG